MACFLDALLSGVVVVCFDLSRLVVLPSLFALHFALLISCVLVFCVLRRLAFLFCCFPFDCFCWGGVLVFVFAYLYFFVECL